MRSFVALTAASRLWRGPPARWVDLRSASRLVPEVPHPGEHHRQAQAVGGVDDFLIAAEATGLYDGRDPVAGDLLHSVGEGKKGVGAPFLRPLSRAALPEGSLAGRQPRKRLENLLIAVDQNVRSAPFRAIVK